MFGRLRLTTTMAIRSVSVLFFLLIIGGRWIVFADGSSGGAGRNGYSGGAWSSAVAPSNVGLAVAVTVMAGLAVAFTVYSRRGSIGSPWSLRRRKHALQPSQWNAFFTDQGRLSDGGVKFLKKVRSGGVDPSIRPEVWPFLLGVHRRNERLIED
ncbi:rab GTPase-activating protein 22-like [Brassica napus]|uniref:rab GTPase-activating protein 22-like n=1 Tax=Brassica napus TaxID=3708 RepID=UPI0020790049|nr:rab GTPase-activating protein 22-like [Brassica napus]